MNNAPATRSVSLSDALLELNTLHVLCDLAELYSVTEADTDPDAVNKLSTMLQVMMVHIEGIECTLEAIPVAST